MTNNKIAVKVEHVSKSFKLPTEATKVLERHSLIALGVLKDLQNNKY